MTIQQKNEEIAKMLGWFFEHGAWFKKIEVAIIVAYSEHNNYPHIGLPFHRDWNWLMIACSFINKIQKFDINLGLEYEQLFNMSILQPIEDVFDAVSKFAEEYNKNKI